jgi:hypothetical protein
MTKLYIGTPAYGCLLNNGYLASLISLRSACVERGVEMLVDFLGNESLIPRARNLIAEKFAQSDATHLLFIDADVAFHHDAVFSMLEADKDVICSVYPKKLYLWDKWERNLNPEEPAFQRCLDFNLNIKIGEKPVEREAGRYVEVLDAATGFLMIKREVILKMQDAFKDALGCKNDVQGYSVDEYVAIFDCMIDPETRRYLSEDYAFCRRWQQLGGKIYADIANVLGHEGTFTFDRSFALRNMKASTSNSSVA